MTLVTIEDAQAKRPEIIGRLSDGEELAIFQGDRVVARLVGERSRPGERPGPGLAKGIFAIVADDDEHLEDFAEYMP